MKLGITKKPDLGGVWFFVKVIRNFNVGLIVGGTEKQAKPPHFHIAIGRD